MTLTKKLSILILLIIIMISGFLFLKESHEAKLVKLKEGCVSKTDIQKIWSGWTAVSGVMTLLANDGGSEGNYVEKTISGSGLEYAYIWKKRDMIKGCFVDISINAVEVGKIETMKKTTRERKTGVYDRK